MRRLLLALLLLVASSAHAGDVDADGIADALDNCPNFANANQSDVGGIGAASGPDGIGDACQCGDVNGNGRVTTADASIMQGALLVPPTQTMARPDLCNVGGSAGCTTADATIITRALLVPPTATVSQSCAPGSAVTDRWLLEGDTQDWTAYEYATGTPFPWTATHTWLCANKAALNLRGIIGTGDIVPFAPRMLFFPWYYGTADAVYDVTDACGLPSALPAGNHDYESSWGEGWAAYLAFLGLRPLHAPAAESPTGLSWVELLAGNFWLAVLPYGASAGEEAWLTAYIAAADPSHKFFVFQHEAVDPALPGTIPTTRTAGRIAAAFGASRVPMVMGGHYFPPDRVQTWVTPSGQRALLSNYQMGNNGLMNFGSMTWLTYSAPSGRWCINDFNQTTGVEHAYEPPTCWVP